MRLSTSTAILHHHFDYALTLTDIPAVIRTAGFDALDWSTWQFCLQGGKVFAGLLNDDAWEAQINTLREADERASSAARRTAYPPTMRAIKRWTRSICVCWSSAASARQPSWARNGRLSTPLRRRALPVRKASAISASISSPWKNWLASWAWALPLKTCPTSRKSAFAARRRSCARWWTPSATRWWAAAGIPATA